MRAGGYWMANPVRAVLVDWPQVERLGETLFPGAVTMYANGSLPMDALDYDDVVVISTDPARIEQFCQQLIASQCLKVRFSVDDISRFTTRKQVETWAAQGRIFDYTAGLPAATPPAPPQEPPACPPPSGGAVPDPADGAGPAQDAPERDLSDIPEGWDGEPEEPADALLRSIRSSSALKTAEHEAATDWTDPADIFNPGIALPEFDPAWIPEPIRAFVTNIHEMQGCDLGIPAMHALTVAAGCISDDIKVSVRRSQEWYESARLWSCVLGRSGDGKSPALRAVMRETRALSVEIAEAAKARMAAYKLEMEVYEAQKKSYVAARAKGDIVGQPPMPPERPVDEQLYFDDTNTEGIADVLQQSSRGSMLVNDELLGWLSSFDRYRPGGDRQFYLETWDGGERVFNRVGRRWIIKACGLSICGNSQPKALQERVAKQGLDSDGLLQRVLVYHSLRDAATSGEIPADQDAIRRWRRIVGNLYRLRTHLDHCYFSAEAQDVFRRAEAWLSDARSAVKMSEAAQEHIAKYRGYLARIALTIHCIECADEDREAVRPEISHDTIAQAWALLRDCMFPHAMKFYGEVLGTGRGASAAIKQVCAYILCRKDMALKLKRRELEVSCREAWHPEGPLALKDVQRTELLNELYSMDWIRPAAPPSRGSKFPAEFHINPALDEKFADFRAAELPKRQAAYQRLQQLKDARRLDRQPGED